MFSHKTSITRIPLIVIVPFFNVRGHLEAAVSNSRGRRGSCGGGNQFGKESVVLLGSFFGAVLPEIGPLAFIGGKPARCLDGETTLEVAWALRSSAVPPFESSSVVLHLGSTFQAALPTVGR